MGGIMKVYEPKLHGKLTVEDFEDQVVGLKFDDESTVLFNYAFVRKEIGAVPEIHTPSSSRKYLVVYTEHCGYHSFPLASVDVLTINPKTGPFIRESGQTNIENYLDSINERIGILLVE